MNNFSDSLLNLLLSWMRGFINNIWSLLAGDSAGLMAWVSRRWRLIAVVLVLLGLALDFVVYLLRWRPQYVWRTWLRHIGGFGRDAVEERAFRSGYRQGIGSLNLEGETRAPQTHSVNELMVFYGAEPSANAPPVDVRSLPGGEDMPLPRRRRSARHGKRTYRTRGLRVRIPALGQETALPTYPAPPVHAREAFHEAVYPSFAPVPYMPPGADRDVPADDMRVP